MAALVTARFKLALRNVTVRRTGRAVLDLPRFDVVAGEALAVIGPNGAGKSTLLLILALLLRPDNGEVLYDDVRVAGGAVLRLRRRMAVVFQDPLLLDRSVQANVETGMRLRGVPRAERTGRARRWLARFGVDALAGRSARTLSGGEAQRVSLARAFALEPDVLLLDEPFSALDQPTRETLIADLHGALRETRTTCVLVTHDRDEAAQLADRVAVLMDGMVRQIGSPSDVFSAPVDEYVAAFVGVETIFPAAVTARREGLALLSAGAHTIEAVDRGAFTEALVCLRPEDVSLLAPGEALHDSARNKIPGRVRRITPSGAAARVEVDCGFTVLARVTTRSLAELGIEPGAPVIASFKATAVHLIPR